MDEQAASLDELLAHREWFVDPQREADADGRAIIIIDGFYDDPERVRRLALDSPFVQYIPPDPALVGEELATKNAHRAGRWLSTAFVVYHGKTIEKPFFGTRHNPPELRARMEALVGEPIDRESWEQGGDFWNGAFHLIEQGFRSGDGVIHHHYKPGDVEGRGWSGLVYLSPDAPPSAGTSFWRKHDTGRCVAAFGEPYSFDVEDFSLVFLAENRFNRLVLFRENVWHRAEHGFSSGSTARLTQTFFFGLGQG